MKIVFISLLWICSQPAIAQSGAIDSILHDLNRINGLKKEDTLFIKKVIEQIDPLDASIVADEKFIAAMNRLKHVLPPDKYVALEFNFFSIISLQSKSKDIIITPVTIDISLHPAIAISRITDSKVRSFSEDVPA